MAQVDRSIGTLGLIVTNCTGNGVSPIVLTVSTTPSSVAVGQRIVVASVGGNTNANGAKVVTAVDAVAKTITFAGTGNGAYTSGGTVARDYSSVDAWNEATRTLNLSSAGNIQTGWLHNDSGNRIAELAGPSTHDLDNAQVDAMGYRELRAWPTDRYDPFLRSGVRLVCPVTTGHPSGLRMNEKFFQCHGIAIKATVAAPLSFGVGLHTCAVVWVSGRGNRIDGCYIDARELKFDSTISESYAVLHDGGLTGGGTNPSSTIYSTVANCIVVGDSADDGSTSGSKPVVCGISLAPNYHLVANNLVLGFNDATYGKGISTLNATNTKTLANVVVDCTTCFVVGTILSTAKHENNASSDSTASDISTLSFGRLSPTRLFRYYAFEDYRPIASSTLVDNGYDFIAGDGSNLIDYNGDVRTAPFEIGPFEGFALVDDHDPDVIESEIGAGLDYATLDAWEAATELHLVDLNVLHRAVIKTDTPGNFTASNAITDQWRYREVVAGNGYRYEPIGATGAVISGVVEILEDGFRLSGVRINNESAGVWSFAHCVVIANDAANVVVDGVYGSTATAAGGGIIFYATDACSRPSFFNCIAVGGTSSVGAHEGFRVDSADGIVANCNALKCRNSSGSGETPHCYTDGSFAGTLFRNCIAGSVGSGTCFDVTAGYQDHNASVDGTAAGVGSNTSLSASDIWYDSGADPVDLRLLSTGVCVNSGVNLSAYFELDFNGNQRVGAWEKGAYDGFLEPPAWPAPAVIDYASIAWGWTIERTDGVTLNFTDAPFDVVHRGLIHMPAGAFEASARRSEVGLAEHNATFRGALSSDAILADDLIAGRYEDARIVENMIDGEFPWRAASWSKTWYIREIKFDGERFSADMIGLSRVLEQRVGESYTRSCRAVLGDSKCTVDLRAITSFGRTVTTATSRRSFIATGIPSQDEGYYSLGIVRWTGGLNAGLESEVLLHTDSTKTIDLFLETPFAIQVGDTFDIVPGCDLAFTTCRDKFNNLANYRGFHLQPGTDKTLQTPRSS